MGGTGEELEFGGKKMGHCTSSPPMTEKCEFHFLSKRRSGNRQIREGKPTRGATPPKKKNLLIGKRQHFYGGSKGFTLRGAVN